MRGPAKILPRKDMWKGLRHGLEKSLKNNIIRGSKFYVVMGLGAALRRRQVTG